jgi:putative hemolysin
MRIRIIFIILRRSISPLITEIVILVVLILVNAFFAASEIALISLNDNKIKNMADDGHKKAILLVKLLGEPSRFLATIQIGITLAGFLASAFAADSFGYRLSSVLIDMGVPVPQAWLENISVVVITLILSYFTLVGGELVPKRLAMKKAEAIAMVIARPLTILAKVTSPFVKLLTLSTNGLVRLFGVDPNAEDGEITEEEIRMMVDVGMEKGTILDSEKQMIHNIFEFDNKVVSEVMTHRTNIVGIPIDYTYKQVIRIINKEKYTRYPVYEDKIDDIVGILHSKDIMQFVEDQEESAFSLRAIIRKPYLIAESKQIDLLFREMQKRKQHMAIVIDEYGGTDGIVTIEDIVEEIVGNIFDEHDEEEKEIVRIDPNTVIIVGTMSLDDIERIYQTKLPIDEYETLSGFLIGQLGTIPGPDDKPIIEFNGLTFKVLESNFKTIKKVKVCRSE